jgi:hypothetical protein
MGADGHVIRTESTSPDRDEEVRDAAIRANCR